MRFWGALGLVLITAASVRCGGDGGAGFVVEYFESKAVGVVTSALCNAETNVWLHKEFSARRIGFDCLDARHLREEEVVRRLTSRYLRLGVVLDLNCPRSMEVLKMADRHQLFTPSNSLAFWLIIASARLSKSDLEAAVETYAPNVTDPIAFLSGAYRDHKNEKCLLEINRKVNSEFLRDYERRRGEKTKAKKPRRNRTEADDLLEMKLLLDNEVVVSVSEPPGGVALYVLYGIHKATPESKPTVIEEGRVTAAGEVHLNGRQKRRKLGDAVLRAVSAIFQPEAFTTIDDLATRESDVWAKLSYPHVKLLAEDLDFRIIIRFFDDYGWQTNGTFGQLMGFMQQKKADLSAAALLLRSDRFGVVDFLECPFRLQTGILFREPSLSSVNNIFLLPFSKAIWVSIGVVILLTVIALRCRIAVGRSFNFPDPYISTYFDICNYIAGAICQQGFPTTPKSPSARISILIILLTSVALFTSYSACIVALLQSSSSAISTISDITRSDLEVGIQANFPLYKVLIKEAVHPVLKEFYSRKVLSKGDKVFCDRRDGIEKMRTGMFAFEVELTAGYKLISETYEEIEKCGIREIDFIPKPFICIAVQKHSPYKELFTQRLIWHEEAGLFDRTWKLWVDQKPKCEVGRIGFISVGLTEFRPALQLFAYGIALAVLFFLLELLGTSFSLRQISEFKLFRSVTRGKDHRLRDRRPSPKISHAHHPSTAPAVHAPLLHPNPPKRRPHFDLSPKKKRFV